MRVVVHLHWNWTRPGDLDRGIRVAVSACGESLPRAEVSSETAEVTCDRCRQIATRGEENLMTTKTEAEARVADMSGPQLVAQYNSIRERNGQGKIKKFRDLETGRRMVVRAMESQEEEKIEENQEESPPENKKKTAKSEKFSRDSTIEILESQVKSKGETKKRWEMLLRSEDKTVGNYLDNIGTSGDLTWWSKQAKIRVV